MHIHTCRSYAHTPLKLGSHKSLEASHYNKGVLADSSDFGLLGSKVHKKGDSLHWTRMNRRAKFDAASFILGREIRNRTNTQTKLQKNKQTNKQ